MRYAAVFLLFFTVSSIFAQIPESIPLEIEDEFDEEALILDYRIKSGERFPGDFRAWKAYRNGRKVREREFYELAGYEENARAVFRYNALSVSMVAAAPLVFCLGALSMAVGTFADGVGLAAGPVIMAGSVVSLIVGIVRLNRRWSSLGEAYPIAEEYNEALLRRLME